jgi:hypothetical protein
MDAYRSQDTVIYRPIGDDPPEAVALCSYGDVMVSLVDVAPSVQVQREAVIGSRWMHQAARGNAGLQMSFSLARAFCTYAAARAWGLDIAELLALYPEGMVTWMTAYHAGIPQRTRDYRATLDHVQPLPPTNDQRYGAAAFWGVLEIQLFLTGDID